MKAANSEFSCKAPGLLFSFHDVTAFHLNRIQRAEELFRGWGIEKAAYLLVPDYHGKFSSGMDENFYDWVRSDHPVTVEWLLHGFYHLEGIGQMVRAAENRSVKAPTALNASPKRRCLDALKRRFLTAGEGEFFDLHPDEITKRLERGLGFFQKITGTAFPSGFVAPAWLYNEHLVPALRKIPISWTEDHHGVTKVQEDLHFTTPVITWATRTLFRRLGSLMVCPAQMRWWENRPLLRIAVHPFDFDHPETIRSIESVVRSAVATRRQLSYKDLELCIPAHSDGNQ